MPVTPNGPSPFRLHQLNRTKDSKMRQPPMTKISDTLCNEDHLKILEIM